MPIVAAWYVLSGVSTDVNAPLVQYSHVVHLWVGLRRWIKRRAGTYDNVLALRGSSNAYVSLCLEHAPSHVLW